MSTNDAIDAEASGNSEKNIIFQMIKFKSDNIKIEVLRYPPVKQTEFMEAFLITWSWDNFLIVVIGEMLSTKTPSMEAESEISFVTDEIINKLKRNPYPC
ncbi:hypothetical protein RhiirB3_522490 [Rhizophagus irregularis]|nr:hypothetical protein RhiirB3_522490 [Rhizophagus irregularis]